MLDKIHDTYLRTKEQDDCTGMEFPTVRLWVGGFGVTKEEKAEGYRGHFARLSIQAAAGGTWTIVAEKLAMPLAKHPQKSRIPTRHPNWGHHVLRMVETGKVLPGIAVAHAQLQALHQEYPDATIPGKDVIHVMVYNRKAAEGDKPAPIEKITIKIKPLSDGGVKLVLKAKARKKKAPPPLPAQKAAKDIKPQGKFTAMLQKKRAPKKPG